MRVPKTVSLWIFLLQLMGLSGSLSFRKNRPHPIQKPEERRMTILLWAKDNIVCACHFYMNGIITYRKKGQKSKSYFIAAQRFDMALTYCENRS